MYHVAYGETHLESDLPPGTRSTAVECKPMEPLTDVRGAIAQALAHPVGSPPLRQIARPGDRVCIVFTDGTRACPGRLLMPALLAELEPGGLPLLRRWRQPGDD